MVCNLPKHVFILVHGNNGSPDDWEHVHRELENVFGSSNAKIMRSCCNFDQTDAGIAAGGYRLFQEIVELFQHTGTEGHQVSLIGHSLGGLFCRYAAGLLVEYLEHSVKPSDCPIQLMSYVSICSPHLGSRRPKGHSPWKNMIRFGVHKVLGMKKIYGQTGMDLLLEDNTVQEASSDVPILERMAHPESHFIRGMDSFRHVTLVSITDGDLLVPYASSSVIRHSNHPSCSASSDKTWLWGFTHRGFPPVQHVILERHDQKLQPLESHSREAVETSSHDNEYVCDTRHQVEFKPEILAHLQRLKWRRIDLTINPASLSDMLKLHDWPIGKSQPSDSKADEFISLLVTILYCDHGGQDLVHS